MIKEIRPVTNLYLKWIDETFGWGVFTSQPIKKDSIVEICYCISKVSIKSSEELIDYVFQVNPNEIYHCLGFGAIYNHSSTPNIVCNYIQDQPLIKFIALMDIEPDEELRHNYGKEYWNTRGKKMI